MSLRAAPVRIFRGSGGALEAALVIPFERLLEHLRDGVACADADGMIVYANRAAELLLGCPHAVLVGRPLASVIAPGDRGPVHEALRHARATGVRQTVPADAIRADGAAVPVEASFSLLEGLVVMDLRDRSERVPLERERHQLALERSQLARILDQLPEGVLVRFEDGSLVVNQAARALMGWPATPERGSWPFSGLLYDEDGRLVPHEELPLVRAPGGARQAEYGFLRRDGSFGTLLVNAAALSGGDEGTVAMAVFQDITERKELERRERILSEVTRVLLEHAGADEVQPLREIVSLVVDAFGDWCGFSLIDENGMLVQVAADHPDPRQREIAERFLAAEPPVPWEQAPTADVLRSGKPAVVESIDEALLRRAGHPEPAVEVLRELGLLSSIVVPMHVAGKIIGHLSLTATGPGGRHWSQEDVAFVSDVADRAAVAVHNARLVRRLQTERAQLAAARDEAARRAAELIAVFDASPDGIVIYDASDRLTYISESLAMALGVPLRHAIGLHFEDVLRSYAAKARVVELEPFLRRTAGMFANRTQTATDEVRIEGAVPQWFRRSTAPVRSPDGAYLGRIFVYTDVTQLRELDRMRTEFLSVASHELKTPLTPLSVDLQLLARAAVRGEPADPALTERALRQVDRLAHLVDDMLELSRTEEGALAAPPWGMVDLRALAGHVVSAVRPPLDAHDVALEAGPGEAVVRGDPVQLERVLRNLLRNALKYSPKQTTVVVRVERIGDLVCTSVRDRGIGIPLDEQPRLFERYFRARNAAARHYGGLGIGLYMSHQIVRHHGGHFEVESTPGQGSTFRFCIPAARSAMAG